MPKEAPGKTISLTIDHVFMPEDLLSNDPEARTRRYPAKDGDGKRAKYRVNDALADLLISKDQAMEVPD